jgi:hypothetical protein
MPRRLILIASLMAFALALGCGGGGEDPANNPNKLEYSKEGPGKRGGPPPATK